MKRSAAVGRAASQRREEALRLVHRRNGDVIPRYLAEGSGGCSSAKPASSGAVVLCQHRQMKLKSGIAEAVLLRWRRDGGSAAGEPAKRAPCRAKIMLLGEGLASAEHRLSHCVEEVSNGARPARDDSRGVLPVGNIASAAGVAGARRSK